MLVAAPGYAIQRIGGVFGTLAGTAVLAAPVIAGAVLAANGPDAIRIGVMLPSAAAYGFALAFAGVRLAATVADSKGDRNMPGSAANGSADGVAQPISERRSSTEMTMMLATPIAPITAKQEMAWMR